MIFMTPGIATIQIALVEENRMRTTDEIRADVQRLEYDLGDYNAWYKQQLEATLLGVEVLLNIQELLMPKRYPLPIVTVENKTER